ncbi:MAG TPA: hypothetical protein VG860_06720 [Terriglobia bacterium]|jgi:hypothetical protein|nr:hypothetical protein [Terriglobia bacterium]
MNEALNSALGRLQSSALGAGAVFLILSAVGWYMNPQQFLHSYLVAFWFWLAVTVGCMAILMIHYMVTGRWGYLARRPLEAGTRVLPLMVLLFVPILVKLPVLYQWANPETLASLNLAAFKRVYLGTEFWVIRAVVYFAIWLLLIYLLNRWSAAEDAGGGASNYFDRMRRLSGPGLVIFGFTVTYAAVDWVMSLEPGFFSTIYGMIFMVVPALLGVALTVLTLTAFSKYEPFATLAEPKRFNDYGNLLLVFTMLWAYLQFDQFLIIWAGNLQDEIPWYVVRARGEWGGVAVALFLFRFAVPFLLLLQRAVTRRNRMLAIVCVILVVMEWVDLYWMISPAFSPKMPQLSWMDPVVFFGIGGVWVAWFAWQLKSRPLLPLHDPRFEGLVNVGS